MSSNYLLKGFGLDASRANRSSSSRLLRAADSSSSSSVISPIEKLSDETSEFFGALRSGGMLLAKISGS